MSTRRRRWHRLVLPFGVFLLLVSLTVTARLLEEPRLGDPATLAPHGTGGDGASELAGMLADQDVAVEFVEDRESLRRALRGPEAVVFLPKPGRLESASGWSALRDRHGHRLVMVAPGPMELAAAGVPVGTQRQRWAPRATEPDCAVAEATQTGRATALRSRYVVEIPEEICYGGGLVRTSARGSEVFVVGAYDPFRNRRIGEHHNAELARQLLTSADRVIWVGEMPADPVEWPQLPAPSRSELDRDRPNAFAALVYGYPAGVLAGLALAAALAVLLALARARRLGPPVAEPLPVSVPASETVLGRGRLYHRAQGRQAALATLRAAALPRLARAVGLPESPLPPADTLVAALAARTGAPSEQVRHTLYGPTPERDDMLMDAVADLDRLVAAVTRDDPTEGGRP